MAWKTGPTGELQVAITPSFLVQKGSCDHLEQMPRDALSNYEGAMAISDL